LKRAGLPATTRFHDLRHSCATLLIAEGVPLKIVSAILGHSGIQITADIYGHVLPESTRAAAAKTEQLLRPRDDGQDTEVGSDRGSDRQKEGRGSFEDSAS
jgi:integrase